MIINLLGALTIAALFFHKELNINYNYMIVFLICLIIFSIIYKKNFENFGSTNYIIKDSHRNPSRCVNNATFVDNGFYGYNNIPVVTSKPVYTKTQVINWDKGLRIDPDGNTWVINNLGVDGHNRVKGDLQVDSNAHIHGITDIDGNLNLHGVADFGNDLHVKGKVNFDNNLTVAGHTALKDGLHVMGPTRMAGDAYITNNATVGNNFKVNQEATFGKDVRIQGGARVDRNFGVGGNSIINGNFAVDGVGTFRDNLGVVGNTMMKGSLNVGDDASFDKNLHVKGKMRILDGIGSGYVASKEIAMADNGFGEIIENRCPDNHYLCGIKARYERTKTSERQWDSGINGLYLKCCSFD